MIEQVLKILKSAKTFVSGEDIAQQLGVSRTAVWKHISKLKSMGYSIESVSNKGYRLVENVDILNANEIDYEGRVEFYDIIGSTNSVAKKFAVQGCEEGTLIACDYQSNGKGRRGRVWEAAKGDSLCFSLVLRPQLAPEDAPQITLLTGLAVAEAIHSLTKLNVGIKWPNDVIVNGKKLVGILTEMATEIDCVEYVVVGVGINVNNKDFPADIRQKATSLKLELGHSVRRADLLTSILERIMYHYRLYCDKGFEGIRSSYNSLCLNVGAEVKTVGTNEIEGIAQGVDSSGELLVKLSDGTITQVRSGEVSLRLKNNEYI